MLRSKIFALLGNKKFKGVLGVYDWLQLWNIHSACRPPLLLVVSIYVVLTVFLKRGLRRVDHIPRYIHI